LIGSLSGVETVTYRYLVRCSFVFRMGRRSWADGCRKQMNFHELASCANLAYPATDSLTLTSRILAYLSILTKLPSNSLASPLKRVLLRLKTEMKEEEDAVRLLTLFTLPGRRGAADAYPLPHRLSLCKLTSKTACPTNSSSNSPIAHLQPLIVNFSCDVLFSKTAPLLPFPSLRLSSSSLPPAFSKCSRNEGLNSTVKR
jgi:hypothetical protein